MCFWLFVSRYVIPNIAILYVFNYLTNRLTFPELTMCGFFLQRARRGNRNTLLHKVRDKFMYTIFVQIKTHYTVKWLYIYHLTICLKGLKQKSLKYFYKKKKKITKLLLHVHKNKIKRFILQDRNIIL